MAGSSADSLKGQGQDKAAPPDLASSLVGVQLSREEMAEVKAGAVKWALGLLLAQAVAAAALALLL